MKPKESVFRRRMVERLSAVDELNEPLRLEPLRGWPFLVVIVLLGVAGSVWALKSTSPITVDGSGVVRLSGELEHILVYTEFDPQLAEGQTVLLETVHGQADTLRGEVVKVDGALSARQAMEAQLDDADLARSLYQSGRRQQVLIRLLEGETSAYLVEGQEIQAKIDVGEVRPVDWLLAASDAKGDPS